MALLLEREAAERLRMSPRRVKRLRLSGELLFLPGKPPRIDERDLEAYRERARVAAAAVPRERRIGPPTLEEITDAGRIAQHLLLAKNNLRRQMAHARAAKPG